MKKASHICTGKRGENEAVRFLLEKDHHILQRNFRTRRGELDIVSLDPEGVLVFCEVKTAKSLEAGFPEEWVTPRKQHKILRMAESYLAITGRSEIFMRFDVIAVELCQGKKPKIRHWENAFLPASISAI